MALQKANQLMGHYPFQIIKAVYQQKISNSLMLIDVGIFVKPESEKITFRSMICAS
ncbi:hypothetical protein BA1DRAFT_00861 [Photorhabdus aegyptia]|uniref:Uncharacterized protein n=1 Tax=Photorhabdus aegyptia TaxID=2805098 RepID=A0A022PKD3_9GAMM|nr:hypothetical protein BA1DRAFT_00861 [Photorhabdus aegyptia]